jgi:hypothetical protein
MSTSTTASATAVATSHPALEENTFISLPANDLSTGFVTLKLWNVSRHLTGQ